MASAGLGDAVPEGELALLLSGGGELPDFRYNVVAQGINDRLIDLGLDHLVLYAHELRDGRR